MAHRLRLNAVVDDAETVESFCNRLWSGIGLEVNPQTVAFNKSAIGRRYVSFNISVYALVNLLNRNLPRMQFRSDEGPERKVTVEEFSVELPTGELNRHGIRKL